MVGKQVPQEHYRFRLGLAFAAGLFLLAALALGDSPTGPTPVAAANLVVTSNADNVNDSNCTIAACTLRQAINLANSNGAVDTITFSDSFDIQLALGELSIAADGGNALTIDATGREVTIRGGSRVLSVAADADVDLIGLVITGGTEAQGAGIYNEGDLALTDSAVTLNVASNAGGGIYNATTGSLTLEGTTVSENDAFFAGGIYNEGTLTGTESSISGNEATAGAAGGIYNLAGTVTLTDSEIVDNSAGPTFVNGGGLVNEGGTVVMNGGEVSGNTAPTGSGGGIITFDSVDGDLNILEATLTLNGTLVTGNSAGSEFPQRGGGIYNNDGDVFLNQGATVSDNTAAEGGGIANIEGHVEITDSVIGGPDPDDANQATAGNGGGIYTLGAGGGAGATLLLLRSSVANNSASGEGGGIYNLRDSVGVSYSTISDNMSGSHGGGIYTTSTLPLPGTLVVGNSTISGNVAGGSGGGIYNLDDVVHLVNSTVSGNADDGSGGGGGIYNVYSPDSAGNAGVTLANVTVSDNSGGGIYSGNAGGGEPKTTKLVNTIVAEQQSGTDCTGSGFESLGHNLDSDDTCGLDASLEDLPGSANANLGALQQNGWPTAVHPLGTGSAAIGAGDLDTCQAEYDPLNPVLGSAPFDQRGMGFDRISPAGGQCDIGAFEVQGQPSGMSLSASPPQATNPLGSQHDVVATLLDGADPVSGVDLTFEIISGPHADPSATQVEATEADGTATFSYTGTEPGTDTIRISCSATDCGGEGLFVEVSKEWVGPTMTKEADPDEVPSAGADVTFTIEIANPLDFDLLLTSIVDDAFGDLDGQGTCAQGEAIAASGSYVCSFTAFLSGDPGTEHVNTVTAVVSEVVTGVGALQIDPITLDASATVLFLEDDEGEEDDEGGPSPRRTPTRTPTPSTTATTTPSPSPTATATPELRPNVGGIFGPLLAPQANATAAAAATPAAVKPITPPSTGDGGLR